MRSLRPKLMRWLKLIAINVAVVLLLLIVVEGVFSYLLLFRDISATNDVPEDQYTEYDPDLGWVSLPNLYVPDLYAPGIYLKTNSQGFRNEKDFEAAVPDGKKRIICSGDSFTFGYGVSNEHTWCQRLSAIDPQLETVNMGQGGYGIDQAYLWYKRDASDLDHHVHVLAFITDDFLRMQFDAFLGYGKPQLEQKGSQLVVKNIPVPKAQYTFSWFTHNRHAFERLRTTLFLNRARQRLGGSEAQQVSTDEDQAIRDILQAMFEELDGLHKMHGRTFVLLYLPVRSDLQDNASDEWIQFVQEMSTSFDILFINAVEVFRSLPLEEAGRLYLRKGRINYLGAAGHFNEQGNELVANLVYEELNAHLSLSQ